MTDDESTEPDGAVGAGADSEAGADGDPQGDYDTASPRGGSEPPLVDRVGNVTDAFIGLVEIVAAAVFAVLFAIGVVDLIIQIVEAVVEGRITDPLTVISFIDTGLLLLIIVEVYQTVIAYTRESDTGVIVRLVIYTGVIAMVRKVIVFRTSEYAGELNALLVAISYTIIIAGLAGLLVASQRYDRIFGNSSGSEA